MNRFLARLGLVLPAIMLYPITISLLFVYVVVRLYFAATEPVYFDQPEIPKDGNTL